MSLPLVTTQNTVLTAIVDALLVLTADDENALYGKTVTSAPLSQAQHSEDQVAAFGISVGDESWYGIGNLKRREVYEISMGCVAYRPGADESAMRAARDASYAMHNAVATYIRDNPHMGGVTIQQLSG